MNKINWVFFGTSEFSVYVLDELKKHNIVPNLIIASPDKPKGRKLIITPPPTKIWAEKNSALVYQPKTLRSVKKDGTPMKEPAKDYLKKFLKKDGWDLFLVASYGKIIPVEIFDIPLHKTLNIHPSLLPKYRGASPIQTQILNDEKNVGVTIMQIDKGMDTGPIIAQRKTSPPSTKNDNFNIVATPLSLARRGGLGGEVNFSKEKLEKLLAIESAKLFVKTLPDWISGKIKSTPQDNNKATTCKKIEKSDGEINLNSSADGDSYKNYLKIKAYEGWPGTYFFTEKNGKKIRVKIIKAEFKDGKLIIKKVIPEGKKETNYSQFLNYK